MELSGERCFPVELYEEDLPTMLTAEWRFVDSNDNLVSDGLRVVVTTSGGVEIPHDYSAIDFVGIQLLSFK